MAIKINASTPPQLGRVTLPKGTYLPNKFSNPSTAADGAIGTGGGATPAVPGSMWGNVTPGYNTQLSNHGGGYNPFSQYAYKPETNNPFLKLFAGLSNPNTANALRNAQVPQVNPTILTQPNTSPTSPKNNSFVGNGILTAPQQMTARQVQSLFGGMTPDQINQVMVAKGYTRTYQAGVGEVFVMTGQPQPQQQGAPLDSRGRPEWVDGASLAQGERVTNANGFTYVGGTPYTNPSTGETVGQYAVTVPGVKDDPKGMYKWTSTTQKDSNGNWVKVYKQSLRKIYTKGGRDQQAARQEASIQAAAQPTTQAEAVTLSQLVNLRADFG